MDLNSSSVIFKYAAVDNSEEVLLVQKGQDGLLYTTGPSRKQPPSLTKNGDS